MTYRGGSYLFGQYGVCALCVLSAHLAGPLLQAKPANGLHIAQAPSPYSLRAIANLTFVEERLCGDPKAMRWEQGVCLAIFHIFMCPLGK